MNKASNLSTFSPVRMETKDLIALAIALASARGTGRQTAESSKPQLQQQVKVAMQADMATWGG
jgi:hypothetical protein